MIELIVGSSTILILIFMYIFYREKTVHKNKKKFSERIHK